MHTGNEQACQHYQNLKLQNEMVRREQMAAEAQQGAADEMALPGPLWFGSFY